MANPLNTQKFIGRNRAPRVHIEYELETWNSEKKIDLPFVVGVMADLSGHSTQALPDLESRKFLEIDVDNFGERMQALKPRVAIRVPNTLTGQGQLQVDMEFERMDDFTPSAIANKIEPLQRLLEARTQLSNLLTYIDGKMGAENLISKLLTDPSLLEAVSHSRKPTPLTEAEKPAK